MEEETININLIIADRPYPLKIKQSEEEQIRTAAQEINQKVKDFQQLYSAKDKQDYLAMCALTYAVESITSKKSSATVDSDIRDEILKFEALLKDFQ